MKGKWVHWLPAGALAVGAIWTLAIGAQRTVSLKAPLQAAIPARIEGFAARDVEVSAEERRAAGVDSYLMRVYSAGGQGAFSLYVGYYGHQTQGKTIHSPKNCLPGAGWEALTFSRATIPTATGTMEVNRYLLQKGKELALVLYWYQGRGRVEADEYQVKWDLLRDSAVKRRSDEALVRIIVPVRGSQEEAFRLAASVATQVMPAVESALPA